MLELSEESWDKILGKYVYEELKNPVEFYNTNLKDLEPIFQSNSFHACEDVFLFEGIEYRCMWTFSDESNDPCQVSIRKPRPRMNPVQLSLF